MDSLSLRQSDKALIFVSVFLKLKQLLFSWVGSGLPVCESELQEEMLRQTRIATRLMLSDGCFFHSRPCFFMKLNRSLRVQPGSSMCAK